MGTSLRVDSAWTRALATLAVAALAFALLPLATAGAQEQEGGGSLPDHLMSGDGDASVAQADSQIDIQRFEGQTRYQTAAEIATAEFDASDNVVIASGEDFPDALAGSALEGSLDAPVLLVPENLVNGSIPGEITDAIDELGATSATFLGGTDAVSSDVEDYIVDNSSVSDTDRVSGATRYETAAAIADEVDAINGNAGQLNGESLAFVATGEDFPDALAAGPAAFDGQHPVLLTPGDELHDAADAALADFDPDTVVVLGGSDAVNPAVEDNLENQNYDVARIGGGNRFETATLLADFFIDDFGFDVDDVGLATGSPFADALASAPHMGTLNGPLLLTPFNTTEDNTLEFFETHGCDIERMHVFGGEEAINEDVAHEYAEAACPDDAEPDDLIVGTVTDAETGEGIEGADVTATNSETFTATTDAEGDYTLDVDAPETYTVSVEADGYEGDTEEDVAVDEGETEEVNFELGAIPGEPGGPFDVTLSQDEDVNPVGTEHTVTATVTDEGENAVADDTMVRFEIYEQVEGQEEAVFVDEGGFDETENGVAEHTYAGPEDLPEAGDSRDDVVVACVVEDTATPCVEEDSADFDPISGDVRNITQEPSDVIEKRWEEREATSVEVTPEEETNSLAQDDHEVVITVRDQFGDPVGDEDVTGFLLRDLAEDEDAVDEGWELLGSETRTTEADEDDDAYGTITVAYSEDTERLPEDPATDNLVVCLGGDSDCVDIVEPDEDDEDDTRTEYTVDEDAVSATAVKHWVEEELTLELTPEEATNEFGEDHEVTATVTDQFGMPAADETVQFEVYRDEADDDDIVTFNQVTTGSDTTDEESEDDDVVEEAGQATFEYSHVGGESVGAEDVIVACIAGETDNGWECAQVGAEDTQVFPNPDNVADDTAEKTWVPAPVCEPAEDGEYTDGQIEDLDDDAEGSGGTLETIFGEEFLCFDYVGDDEFIVNGTEVTEESFEAAVLATLAAEDDDPDDEIDHSLDVDYNEDNPFEDSVFDLTTDAEVDVDNPTFAAGVSVTGSDEVYVEYDEPVDCGTVDAGDYEGELTTDGGATYEGNPDAAECVPDDAGFSATVVLTATGLNAAPAGEFTVEASDDNDVVDAAGNEQPDDDSIVVPRVAPADVAEETSESLEEAATE